MKLRTVCKYLFTMPLVVLPLSSASAGDASIGISGVVRTVCNVSLSNGAAGLHAGENRLGHMVELCNSVDGYRVILRHPAGLTNAFFIVDGQRLPLAPGTATIVVDSNAPTYNERQVALWLSDTPPGSALAISLSAEPKGPTF